MSVKVHEPVCMDSPQDLYFWFDHFLGDQLKDEWRSTGGAGGSADVVDVQTGGIVRVLTDGDNGDAWEIDWNNIRSLHVDQKVTMECRVKLSSATFVIPQLSIFFDDTTYIRIFARDDVGGATNWIIRCRNGGATTDFDSGITIDTDYHIYRMECHAHGGNHVHFYIDGAETANSPITINIPDDAGDFLMPHFKMETRENATKSMDIDYVVVRQDR